jgi:3-hydroxyisobutyrate dehydrogenase-like beta-hydroxyacid dehydrogenase
VLITLLSDGRAVEEVMDGQDAAEAPREGATWIHSRARARVRRRGRARDKGELLVFASGPEAARAICQPIFDVIAKGTRWVGEAGFGTGSSSS